MPTVTRDDLILYYVERGDPAGPPVADARQLDLRSILDYGLRHGEINRVVGAFLRGLPLTSDTVAAGSP